jgi:hypothetical protein
MLLKSVGKSTFINAFVNYLTFDTLEDAKQHDGLAWVIPCSFSTQTMDREGPDGEIVETEIKVGSRTDENDGSRGASATQQTVVHVSQKSPCRNIIRASNYSADDNITVSRNRRCNDPLD